MSETFTSKTALWSLFASSIVLAACFPFAASVWELTFVDALSSPEETRLVIAGFTTEQRIAHAWLTATLDVLFPLAYGGLFAACALRFFPNYRWLALPGLLVIPVDLMEGVVQVLALAGVTDWLAAKAILTPLKMALFWIGIAIVIVGLVVALLSRKSPADSSPTNAN